MSGAMPFTIVLGNSKGGTGKSTLAVALLQAGYRVGSMDLDVRQGSFSRYLANRRAFGERQSSSLALPRHVTLDMEAAAAQDAASAHRAMRDGLEQVAGLDILVLDTPGADTELSRAGHALADVLVTPVNDSLMDLDVLAEIDPARRRVTAPSHYTKRIWEITNTRATAGQAPVDWILVRNRLSHSMALNAREIDRLLPKLAERIGFRVAQGLRERVIYRELFLDGLTVLDLSPTQLAASHSRGLARQEVFDLVADIGLSLPQAAAKQQSARPRPLSSASPVA